MNQDLPLWRSMLFVPANVERFVDKAHERGADAIILDLEDRTAHLVLIHQLLLTLFCIDVHRTELPTLKPPAAHPHPLLAKEDWPWIVDLDGHRNKWQKKAKNAQANQQSRQYRGIF